MPTHERPQSGRSKHTNGEDADQSDVAEHAPGASETSSAMDDDIDSILDEIDEVLEENAEEFVRGFVQKGGQ